MKVLFAPSGGPKQASSRVRVYWVVEEFDKKDVSFSMLPSATKLDILRFAVRIPFNDAIVFQKTYSRWHCLLLRLARRLGKVAVLDLDDAPSRTQNPTTLKNVEFMMTNASAVTVGGKNLFEYASRFQENVVLIPSSIKLSNYHIKNDEKGDAPVCLGWIGNGKHYQQDLLEILVPVITRLTQKHKLFLKIVGACGQEELHRQFGAIPNLRTELVDSLDWSDAGEIRRATADFDIGLYPLLANDFNHYKCGFKALEYMASGIPVVSSRVAMNEEIISHRQSGFMVDGVEEWTTALEQLIVSPEKRNKMGLNGRQIVEERFDVCNAAKQLELIVSKP